MDEKIENLGEELPEPWWKGPLKYILGLFLILLLIVWFFPSYAVKLDPEPRQIPSIDEIEIDATLTKETYSNYLDAVNPINPAIKQTANKVVSVACDGHKVCQAKALYYFVRDNFDYISDPITGEYIENPVDFMLSGGGDCESGTILLSSLLGSIGIYSELVSLPRHMILRIYFEDASKRYKHDDGYIYLDWTCGTCEFGKVGDISKRSVVK